MYCDTASSSKATLDIIDPAIIRYPPPAQCIEMVGIYNATPPHPYNYNLESTHPIMSKECLKDY